MFKKVFFFIVLGISFFGFGQKDCDCSTVRSSFKRALEPNQDALKKLSYVAPFVSFNNPKCKLSYSLFQLENFYNEKTIDSMRILLNDLALELNNNDCEGFSNALFNLYKAKYYRINNQFDSLGIYAYKTISFTEHSEEGILEVEALKQLVFMYTRMSEKQLRWENVGRAKKLILQLKDYPSSSSNFRWLGYQYENQFTETEDSSLLDSTEIFINQAKVLALQKSYFDELARIYRGLEAVSYHKGNLKEALVNIDSAIYYAKRVKGRLNFSGLYLSKAWDHFDLGEFKATEIFTDSMLYYDDKLDYVGYMMTLSQAAELYEGVGNTKKALESYKKYSKIKDSIFTKQRVEAINELEKKYEIEKKEKEILSQENEISLLYIFIIIFVALVILAFLIFKQLQLKKEQKLNQQLQKAIAMQENLEREVSNARENIAQDFHDEMGNKLARITLLSNLIQNDKGQNTNTISKIHQISEDAKALYFGTRDFIFSLKSNSDCLDEVITYLSDFGEDYFSKSHIKFILKQDIESNIKLPFYWSKQLVFIFKEAMTNALKHAQCNEVHLSFHFKKDVLSITFKDNGIGISKKFLESQNGLKNMNVRAHKIGGVLRIKTAENKGTIIIFEGKTTSKGGIC